MAGTHEYGARFLVLKLRTGESTVTYRAAIERPGGVAHRYEVLIDATAGTQTFSARSDEPGDVGPPEPWMDTGLRALVDQAARKGRRTGTWPRKIKQWKASPVQ